MGEHAHRALLLDQQIRALGLEQLQVFLLIQLRADRAAVQRPVALRTGGAHRRALAGVQGTELDAGGVRGAGHGAAQRIDLAGQVALADAADRRIAGHLTQRFHVLGEQQRAPPHAGAGQRGFGAGVAAADDDDFKILHGRRGQRKRGAIVGQNLTRFKPPRLSGGAA